MVLGAGGMLGTEVVGAARTAGLDVRAVRHSDLDVTDRSLVNDHLTRERPDFIVNCAAWTDVDGAEDDPAVAESVNAEGAAIVAEAAAAIGAAVVYVSSDYVFDGSKGSPYVESDPPAPLSAYGISKLKGEQATLSANPRSFVVRTAWLFGHGGPNFVSTMIRLGREKGTVQVVDDQVGSPTWTGHLAPGLIQLMGTNHFGVHHMAAAGHCSWYDFAREIFDREAISVVTRPVSTDALGRKAPRPAFSALESEHEYAIELPEWREGLAGYLACFEGDR